MQSGSSSQRIFVTGATGFVGSAVVEELLGRGYQVSALVHRGELQVGAEQVRVFRGDLFHNEALDPGISGCAAVIHLVGIIEERPRRGVTFQHIHVEGTKNVLEAAQRAGVRRFLQMSALGARADAPSQYHKTKFAAEELVRASGLDATIFRPSLTHGPRGEFLQMEVAWARGKKPPFLFMPYFGSGLLGLQPAAHIQPVYVKDVARAYVDAIEKPQTFGQTYPVCGSQVLSWPQMHHVASEIIRGKRKAALAMPAWYAKLLTYVVPGALLPFTRDQVTMSLEENTSDMKKFIADFGWEPAGFAETLKRYAGVI